jgi:predicted amidophosphoribosyltransferase
VPIVHRLLYRPKATIMQKQMHRAARQANMAAAFAVNPLAAKAWQGKHIVLIDDVWTTGATLASAMQTLRDAGVGAVSVATVARVLRQEN